MPARVLADNSRELGPASGLQALFATLGAPQDPTAQPTIQSVTVQPAMQAVVQVRWGVTHSGCGSTTVHCLPSGTHPCHAPLQWSVLLLQAPCLPRPQAVT